MTHHSQSTDPRLVGALLALALDIAMLVLAALLVLVSLSPAFGFVLAGTVGLVVAPLLGWRYGQAAVSRGAAGWAGDALRSVVVISAAVVVGLVVLQAIAVPVEGGIGGRLALVAYAALMDTIIVGLLTLLAALPLGLAWARLMSWVVRSVPHP